MVASKGSNTAFVLVLGKILNIFFAIYNFFKDYRVTQLTLYLRSDSFIYFFKFSVGIGYISELGL